MIPNLMHQKQKQILKKQVTWLYVLSHMTNKPTKGEPTYILPPFLNCKH